MNLENELLLMLLVIFIIKVLISQLIKKNLNVEEITGFYAVNRLHKVVETTVFVFFVLLIFYFSGSILSIFAVFLAYLVFSSALRTVVLLIYEGDRKQWLHSLTTLVITVGFYIYFYIDYLS
ncbi:DUF4181 domain-containing protein [Piscibacillus sp. B03]|uniref:DUF4181 domain-containing protein n=1 Tax=Piscibacillus sp. B03 TaxID=3457430 RepID=UPI003FCD4B08